MYTNILCMNQDSVSQTASHFLIWRHTFKTAAMTPARRSLLHRPSAAR